MNYEPLLENRRWLSLLTRYESALSWAFNAKVAEFDPNPLLGFSYCFVLISVSLFIYKWLWLGTLSQTLKLKFSQITASGFLLETSLRQQCISR